MHSNSLAEPSPRIRDSGIFHALLQLPTLADLQGHPKLGASWEDFALEHVIGAFETRNAYFWATHGSAEMDLLVMVKGKRYGVPPSHANCSLATCGPRVLRGIWT